MPPKTNYAPFPASIDIMDNGDGSITISWEGSDLDDDISSYEIYFGTSDEPDLVHSATDDGESLTQSITYGTTHYLEIVTTDALGNKSTAKRAIKFQG